MSLRRAYTALRRVALLAGLALGGVSLALCLWLRGHLAAPGPWLDFLTAGLPLLWAMAAVLVADRLFYRQRLRAPLDALAQEQAQARRSGGLADAAGEEPEALRATLASLRRALEAQSAQADRLAGGRQRADALIARELRDPLTALLGTLRMQQDALARSDWEQAADNLAAMEEYAEDMSSCLERLGAVGQLEDLTPRPARQAWLPLLEELGEGLSLMGAGAGLDVRLTAAKEAPDLCVDRELLFGVAEELVVNGLRFARCGVDVRLERRDDTLALTVEDDGPGYRAALLDGEFGPFAPADPIEIREHPGLGLYRCRVLCEKHGGALTLANTPRGALAAAELFVGKGLGNG